VNLLKHDILWFVWSEIARMKKFATEHQTINLKRDIFRRTK
jgi:hypothetical protein